jgi:hypothetical protein
MKSLKLLLTALFFVLLLSGVKTASAQCAMCTTTVETNAKNGGNISKGLNNGVFVLLAAPYLAVGIAGYVWYRKYRRKNVSLKIHNEKLHLN